MRLPSLYAMRVGNLDHAAFAAIKMGKRYVNGIRRNKRSRAFRPFYYKHRTFRKVIFPSDRNYVILAMQPIEVHVDKQGGRTWRRVGCAVFLNDAECGAGNPARDTHCLG